MRVIHKGVEVLWTRRRVLRTLAGTVGGGVLATVAGAYLAPAPSYARNLRAMARPRRHQRVLVFSPHPDDETIGAGGLIRAAVEQGAEVRVCLITYGDGFVEQADRYYLSLRVTPTEYLRLGGIRRKESLAALQRLSVPATSVSFLGFPDGVTDRLFLTHWSGDPLQSPTTLQDRVPYQSATDPGLLYLGSNEFRQVRNLIQSWQPDLLIYPNAYDNHPDHWATNAFVELALAQLTAEGFHPPDPAHRYTYLIHWLGWPLPLGYHPGFPEAPPENLLYLGTGWEALPLSSSQVVAKEQALLRYQSQVELIKPFMLAFARQTELYGVIAPGVVPVAPSGSMRPEDPLAGWPTGPVSALRNPAPGLLGRWLGGGAWVDYLEWVRSGRYEYLRWRTAAPTPDGVTFRATIHTAGPPVRVVALTVGPGRPTTPVADGPAVYVQRRRWHGLAFGSQALAGSSWAVMGLQVYDGAQPVSRTIYRAFRLQAG